MTARTAATTLLDHLMAQGYEPQDYGPQDYGHWYDLTASGTGTVRIVLHPDDEYSADIALFDKHMACEWQVHTSPGIPDAVTIAVLEAAEWQLADKRGCPVTPAQEAAA